MATTVTNLQPDVGADRLRSVRNDEPSTELAVAPKLMDHLVGSSGTKDAVRGSSAEALLVRGTTPLQHKARATGSVLETILGDDERVQVRDTEQTPWRMICSLEIHSRFGEFIGTGWFAGPKTVVTAGHCVHHNQMGGWATEIVVRAGRDGAKTPFGSMTSKRFSTTDRWFCNADPDFDYAAIHLGDDGPPVTGITGWFSTAVLNDGALQSQRVNLAGYPGDKGGATLWFHAKQIVFVAPDRVFYDVDTVGGQSGAPVFLATDDGPRVIGIHAYGVGASMPNVEANSAPRITDAVLQRIREWLAA